MKLLKLAGLSLCAGVAALSIDALGVNGLSLSTTASAQQLTLDKVLENVRAERRKSAQENREREEVFRRNRNTQRAELNKVRGQKDAAKAETTRLEAVREANRAEIEKLSAELDQANGEFRDLFGAARASANELNQEVSSSLISSQYPGRGEALLATARSEKLPSIGELENLWLTYSQEMAEQAKIASYPAQVVGKNGEVSERQVTRIGPFTAFSGGDFLEFKTDSEGNSVLTELKRQPTGNRNGLASNVENSNGGSYVRGVVDPTLGRLLGLTVEVPTLRERLDQGGLVGYFIVGIAALGILLGLFKLITLILTNGAVRSQARSKKASKGNPLGRVMMAYEGTNTGDVETVALKLDDAVLREIPRLESGLNFIKVLAAVAPLLGLLGTVIGMIQTFQAITLFGTGDPQIMAGGISSALVTTVLGLVAAIPLLFLHAFASGAAKGVTQTLEEKSAGIIAQHAEGRG